jgi:uncharacterized membrane protein YgcG
MAMYSRLVPLALAATALAGCQSVDPVTQSPDPRFGEAVAWNKAVQTVNPEPVYPAGSALPGADAARAAAAVDRYRKGAVKQPERISVGSGSGGGSSGGGGGGR